MGASGAAALGLQGTGSALAEHRLRCPAPCGIILDQGPTPRPLHCRADSSPLDHQGNPQALSLPAQTSTPLVWLPPCPSQPDLLKQTEGISPRWCPGTPVPKPLPGCPSHSRVKAKLSGGLPAALSVPWPGLLHSLCSRCISHKASQLLAAHRMCASGPLHRL